MGANDAFLLDGYSLTVTEVVDRAAPSVASMHILPTQTNGFRGSGSGFVCRGFPGLVPPFCATFFPGSLTVPLALRVMFFTVKSSHQVGNDKG